MKGACVRRDGGGSEARSRQRGLSRAQVPQPLARSPRRKSNGLAFNQLCLPRAPSSFSWRMTLQTDIWEVTVLGQRCETSACIPPLPTPQSPGLPCATVQVHPRRTTSVSSCLSPIPCHMDTVSCPSLLCNVPLRRPVRKLASVLALPSGQRLIR